MVPSVHGSLLSENGTPCPIYVPRVTHDVTNDDITANQVYITRPLVSLVASEYLINRPVQFWKQALQNYYIPYQSPYIPLFGDASSKDALIARHAAHNPIQLFMDQVQMLHITYSDIQQPDVMYQLALFACIAFYTRARNRWLRSKYEHSVDPTYVMLLFPQDFILRNKDIKPSQWTQLHSESNQRAQKMTCSEFYTWVLATLNTHPGISCFVDYKRNSNLVKNITVKLTSVKMLPIAIPGLETIYKQFDQHKYIKVAEPVFFAAKSRIVRKRYVYRQYARYGKLGTLKLPWVLCHNTLTPHTHIIDFSHARTDKKAQYRTFIWSIRPFLCKKSTAALLTAARSLAPKRKHIQAVLKHKPVFCRSREPEHLKASAHDRRFRCFVSSAIDDLRLYHCTPTVLPRAHIESITTCSQWFLARIFRAYSKLIIKAIKGTVPTRGDHVVFPCVEPGKGASVQVVTQFPDSRFSVPSCLFSDKYYPLGLLEHLSRHCSRPQAIVLTWKVWTQISSSSMHVEQGLQQFCTWIGNVGKLETARTSEVVLQYQQLTKSSLFSDSVHRMHARIKKKLGPSTPLAVVIEWLNLPCGLFAEEEFFILVMGLLKLRRIDILRNGHSLVHESHKKEFAQRALRWKFSTTMIQSCPYALQVNGQLVPPNQCFSWFWTVLLQQVVGPVVAHCLIVDTPHRLSVMAKSKAQRLPLPRGRGRKGANSSIADRFSNELQKLQKQQLGNFNKLFHLKSLRLALSQPELDFNSSLFAIQLCEQLPNFSTDKDQHAKELQTIRSLYKSKKSTLLRVVCQQVVADHVSMNYVSRLRRAFQLWGTWRTEDLATMMDPSEEKVEAHMAKLAKVALANLPTMVNLFVRQHHISRENGRAEVTVRKYERCLSVLFLTQILLAQGTTSVSVTSQESLMSIQNEMRIEENMVQDLEFL